MSTLVRETHDEWWVGWVDGWVEESGDLWVGAWVHGRTNEGTSDERLAVAAHANSTDMSLYRHTLQCFAMRVP